MSHFVVHTAPGSPFGRAVAATLEEKGISFRLARLAFRSPERLALNPFGRIPIFDHDGFRLYETQAILRYIDRILPTPALTPSDAKSAARMDQLMNINDWYLYQGVANVILFQRIVVPREMKLPSDEDAIKAAMPKAQVVFDELARFLGQQEYLTGDALSLADLLVAPAMAIFTQTPEWSTLGTPHANLVAWLDRMQARSSMKATTYERLSQMGEAA
jgi:glutathione S-transferase